jgi:hypothetical protein
MYYSLDINVDFKDICYDSSNNILFKYIFNEESYEDLKPLVDSLNYEKTQNLELNKKYLDNYNKIQNMYGGPEGIYAEHEYLSSNSSERWSGIYNRFFFRYYNNKYNELEQKRTSVVTKINSLYNSCCLPEKKDKPVVITFKEKMTAIISDLESIIKLSEELKEHQFRLKRIYNLFKLVCSLIFWVPALLFLKKVVLDTTPDLIKYLIKDLCYLTSS